MKRNSINTNMSLQEIENDDDDEHVKSNIREEIWIENGKILYRKTTTETVKKYFEPKKRYPDEFSMKRFVTNSEEAWDTFKLIEISEEKLALLRSWKIPTFILKNEGKYFYTHVPRDFNLTGTLKVEHRCAPRTAVCKRLSPLPDCNGGCRKVRDAKKYLEKYDWIKTGYETCYTDNECFVVINCLHQELVENSDHNGEVTENRILKLASFIWNDVENASDMRKRIMRNISR